MVRRQLYDPEAGRQAKAQDIVQETFIPAHSASEAKTARWNMFAPGFIASL